MKGVECSITLHSFHNNNELLHPITAFLKYSLNLCATFGGHTNLGILRAISGNLRATFCRLRSTIFKFNVFKNTFYFFLFFPKVCALLPKVFEPQFVDYAPLHPIYALMQTLQKFARYFGRVSRHFWMFARYFGHFPSHFQHFASHFQNVSSHF